MNRKEIVGFIQKTLREMDLAEVIAATSGAGTSVSAGSGINKEDQNDLVKKTTMTNEQKYIFERR